MKRHSFLLLSIILAFTLLLTPSCGTTSDQDAGGSSDADTQSGEDDLTVIDLWTQAVPDLRSITLELTLDYAQGGGRTLTAQIDESGNQYLRLPLQPPPEATADPEANVARDFELFIVDGAAYSRIGGEGKAIQDDSYLEFLADTLAGPEGPGIWLNMVSEEGYRNEGSETFSGFSTTRYAVDGQVGEGRISGTIWVDTDSAALVGADLTVTENVFFPPGAATKGDVHIQLTVQRSDVPEITLP